MDAALVDEQSAQIMVTAIEAERGGESVVNEHLEAGGGEGGEAGDGDGRPLAKLSARQLVELLHERERLMRQGGGPDGEATDQWRVYSEIVQWLSSAKCLRMMIQASAGTGKSFLLTSIYLWCVVHGMACRAAAPTGIAASNIEIDGTEICAATLHNVFGLDSECSSSP